MSGAIAVFSANIAAFIPENVLMGLHSTRLQHGNVNQISSRVQELRTDTRRMARDYHTLLTRLDLLDDDRGETVRRLAAVERSLPLLIESLPLNSDIDRSLLTASFTSDHDAHQEDGATVVIRHRPLFGDGNGINVQSQPLPPAIEHTARDAGRPTEHMQGVAVGGTIVDAEAADAWRAIASQAGDLLLGTVPLLIESSGEAGSRIVAGPLPDPDSARALCARLERAAVPCDPSPYEGSRIKF